MINDDPPPVPSKLLEAFLSSGRSERAFAALIDSLARLVQSSAIRRRGQIQVAEEVSQNVFALLARKASSLRNHPCLEAWAIATIRLDPRNPGPDHANRCTPKRRQSLEKRKPRSLGSLAQPTRAFPINAKSFATAKSSYTIALKCHAIQTCHSHETQHTPMRSRLVITRHSLFPHELCPDSNGGICRMGGTARCEKRTLGKHLSCLVS